MLVRILVCCLWLLPLLARAGGFVYGPSKSMERLRETDQVAVIDLQPGKVTVDMYIAIDGIPAGETVTYILPFWHKPEGYLHEEMTSKAFGEQFVRPAREPLVAALNQYAGSLDMMWYFSMLGASAAPGACLSRLFFSTFGETGPWMWPYTSSDTPHAQVELYEVHDDGLRALIAKAGLPDSAIETLRRYNTPYFALMRLTGCKVDEEEELIHGKGVHYHFTHSMDADSYTYTYPLGTGAAWALPILHTEVYLRCPEGWYLNVTAPTEGAMVKYGALQLGQRALAAQKTMTQPDVSPTVMTATFGDELPRYPNAWHRAYAGANPSMDISVTLVARPPEPWRAPVLMVAGNAWTIAGLVVLNILLAWGLAIPVCFRNIWRKAGKPNNFWAFVMPRIRYVVTSSVWYPILVPLLAPLIIWWSYRCRRHAPADGAEATMLKSTVNWLFLMALVLYGILAYATHTAMAGLLHMVW